MPHKNTNFHSRIFQRKIFGATGLPRQNYGDLNSNLPFAHPDHYDKRDNVKDIGLKQNYQDKNGFEGISTTVVKNSNGKYELQRV